MDPARTAPAVDEIWTESVLPSLSAYIEIPCQSPLFDPDWRVNGHIERAVRHVTDWVASRRVPGLTIDVLRHEDRTPLIVLERAGTRPGTVLLYGHIDKQPPFEGWSEGLGPWTPVVRGDGLYGRGAGDDGYAIYAITAAIEALAAQDVPHPRLLAIVEASEESGSPDLPAYMELLSERIGKPDLVIGLDSGAGDYERLWNTTSLRGIVAGDLVVSVLTEGVHSGDASGIVPSSFRILRQLLDRLEDAELGTIRPAGLHVPVPAHRAAQARVTAEILGNVIHARLPFVPGVRPVTDDLVELLLNRTWRPTLSVTAQAGMPPLQQGGNVLRPFTAVKLSIRTPPTLDALAAAKLVRELLTADPPHGARVEFLGQKASQGWEAPPPAPWLTSCLEESSRAFFGKPAADMGEGGSIPFMAMLGRRYPEAQFLITGVLGPGSNAHGPNEYLNLPTARRVTACVAHVIAEAGRATRP